MGIISDLFSAAVMITNKNIKVAIILVLIVGIFFPVIDSLLIKPIQIEQEISVLNKIHDLEGKEFSSEIEKRLKNDIELKVKKYLENNQVSINLKQRFYADPWKFYSGISVWVIVLFMLVIQKKTKWYMKIASIIMVLIFIAVIGAIGLLLPTIGSPWVNYFLYPALQLVFIGSILDIKTKKEK